MEEAQKYNVLPLDDRLYERFNPAMAGRPDLMGSRTSLTLYDGMNVAEMAGINTKNVTYTITADVDLGPAQPPMGLSFHKQVVLVDGHYT